jgi:hypothetical protein
MIVKGYTLFMNLLEPRELLEQEIKRLKQEQYSGICRQDHIKKVGDLIKRYELWLEQPIKQKIGHDKLEMQVAYEHGQQNKMEFEQWYEWASVKFF